MKKVFFSIIAVTALLVAGHWSTAEAQVAISGVDGVNPVAGTVLDLSGATDEGGLLLPRVTALPGAGSDMRKPGNLVYLNDAGTPANSGVYSYDGSTWIKLGAPGETFTLTAATASALGGVKIGTGVTVLADGTISVNLPTKASLGLSNVDNTSDVNKPVSTATQTALNAKSNLVSPGFSGTPTAPTAVATVNNTQLATTAFVNTAVAAGKSAAAVKLATGADSTKLATAEQVSNRATAVGTSTTATTYPTAGAVVTALNLKANSANPTFTGTVTTPVPTMPSQTAKTFMAAPTDRNGVPSFRTIVATDLPGITNSTLAAMPANTFKGNNTAAAATAKDLTVAETKALLALQNVDNTSDLDKPVSTATQAALNLKANSANPTFTGTVTTPVPTMPSQTAKTFMAAPNAAAGVPAFRAIVATDLPALANSNLATMPANTFKGNNTAAAAAPADLTVAQVKTALALNNVTNESKATMFTSPGFTGTPTAPTAGAGTNTTQLATTAFVTTADNLKANLASPALTGTPTAPTAATATNTTQIATTAYVKANIAAIPTATTSVAGLMSAADKTALNNLTSSNPGDAACAHFNSGSRYAGGTCWYPTESSVTGVVAALQSCPTGWTPPSIGQLFALFDANPIGGGGWVAIGHENYWTDNIYMDNNDLKSITAWWNGSAGIIEKKDGSATNRLRCQRSM
ncbi:hypothetical protein FACS189423_07590 [Bacteroidia bacterium]|nr:hypothetical protein FACS189423_07590 [Bacteroidia bacterium]